MSNQNEGEFSGIIVTSGDLSLEERVTALEKQLSDTQATMSCDDLPVLNQANALILLAKDQACYAR